MSNIIGKSFGGRFFQKYWNFLLRLSLNAMNIGGGSEVEESGEAQVIDYVIEKLGREKPLIIFDVGANVGNYAFSISKKLKENDSIYCFEPSKNTFECLENNVKGKDIKNISLFNFGFGEKCERVAFFSNRQGSGIASVYKRRLDHFNIQMDFSEEIDLSTIDNFVKERGIPHINLLKLDVEGHELMVLAGARDFINSRSIDFIQFEFGGCNIDSKTYFQDFFYLLNDKYEIYRILRRGFFPVKQYQETLEQFRLTNFLAVSRNIK